MGGMFIRAHPGRVGSGLECGNAGNRAHREEATPRAHRKCV